ncbi:hypothetical protein HHL28_17930 [Aerophototrophica crusticola]|uniref:Uncharacterized protein n=1 Tax=Aerophototrophica crusticola TaxID=1709002 RepID=A0A858RBA9_9PROT|nr:hypothetical protein HHL28_17930 [Rhodospirillaceae bacterium B3]
MTDFTIQGGLAADGDRDSATGHDGFFTRPKGGFLRELFEDFRAVPGEAWIILAVATVMSNLFIALA